jgi:phage-related protein
MSIRRKLGGPASRRPLRPLAESCLNLDEAMRESRDAVNKIFGQTAEEVEEEIARARNVFEQAGNSLSGENSDLYNTMTSFRNLSQSAFGKASSAAAKGEQAARAATDAMVERLSKIAASLADAAGQGPSGSSQ